MSTIHPGMQMEQPENLTGALIFWTYIAAALLFSCLIISDLAKLNVTSRNGEFKDAKRVCHTAENRRRARVFMILAAISFTILSFHMLSFLLVSYENWSRGRWAHRLRLSWRGANQRSSIAAFVRDVWQWSISSTLFRDFATVICDTPQRFWWTQQALLYSFAWNIYMCIEGTRRQVPHLWAYYVLGQILPISFTQNLFSVALFLLPTAKKNDFLPSTRLKQSSVLAIFFGSLLVAPLAIDTDFYLASLFLTRALLFAPLFFMKPSRRVSMTASDDSGPQPFFSFKSLGLAIGVFLHALQTFKAGSASQYLKAINESHAVAALGYDYIVGVFSACVLWYCMTVEI